MAITFTAFNSTEFIRAVQDPVLFKMLNGEFRRGYEQ